MTKQHQTTTQPTAVTELPTAPTSLPSATLATTTASLPNQPLTRQFRTYLQKQGLAAATLKNYVSDVDRFLEWLAQNLQEDTLEARQLTQTSFEDYSRFLNNPQNHIHPATANRYLSSLRAFGEFLVSHNLATLNPTLRLSNQRIDPTIDQVLNDFKVELTKQKLSPSTIKNYYSDVKQYLIWSMENIKKTDNKLELLS